MGLILDPGCQEFLRTLAAEPKKRLRAAVDALAHDPYPAGFELRVLRVRHHHRFVRCRVGDYRIIYSPRTPDTTIWRIMHRSEGYDWLDHFDPAP